ncbi:NAD(P)H-dependent glycerol-3-phosphate dehydrogenase [Pseudonocardia eucalypti]|uniref:Glycerol-3-phosphate dehydrogenase [NAD(P)+] n=1 Tax=Pseudonocardia eucalypti TaxID=648755 RepID=A0ABP9QBH6_9PSEU|nr:glycerol-3-phosphate dehydrogenase (NAD(P)+) [Pseudonocardia eucalypti]
MTPEAATGTVPRIRRAAVLGAGSWGTSFAKVLADAGREVSLWARRPEVVKVINADHRNPDYLPGIRLPENLVAVADPAEAMAGADVVVFAVPSQTLRANLTGWRPALPEDVTLVSLAKGVELGTLNRMSQVIAEVAGVADDRIAVLSGPNLAREIAEEQPTATVVACPDHQRAVDVQLACTSGYFRVYTNTDVVGAELGGAGKNVIALACGIAAGMGLGDNTRASLMTRGLAELGRLGVRLGADPLTFAGLAGMGDLVATCSSRLSRNRTFGEHLGRGESLAEAEAANHGQVAEGVKSCLSICELARRHQVDVPITDGVRQVCHEGLSASAMAKALVTRTPKPE